MSDRDTITKILDEARIEWTSLDQLEQPDNAGVANGIRIEVDKEKVRGYTGFLTEFYFDDGGNLLRMGVWE